MRIPRQRTSKNTEVAPKVPPKAGNARGRRPEGLTPKRGGEGDAFVRGRELSRSKGPRVDEFDGAPRRAPPALHPDLGGNTRGGRRTLGI